jgi:hypothetical protein
MWKAPVQSQSGTKERFCPSSLLQAKQVWIEYIGAEEQGKERLLKKVETQSNVRLC